VSVGILAELLGQSSETAAKYLLVGATSVDRNIICLMMAVERTIVGSIQECTLYKRRDSGPFRTEDDHMYIHIYIDV